jgi:hypothetical protein
MSKDSKHVKYDVRQTPIGTLVTKTQVSKTTKEIPGGRTRTSAFKTQSAIELS